MDLTDILNPALFCTETVRFGAFFALNWCEIVLNGALRGRTGFNSLAWDTSNKPTLKGGWRNFASRHFFSKKLLTAARLLVILPLPTATDE